MAEIDRRNFLRLVGAGAGAAAASGCSDHVEKLIPYVIQPEEITPGLPVFYASTCRECPAGCGLHVRTREGRPVKLEGNPEHPVNRGALCARGQASVGRTYLPDRYPGPLRRTPDGFEPIPWDEAHALLAEKVREAGAGTRILGGRTGPTLSDLIDRWTAAVGAGPRVVYEPFDYSALEEASRAVFGVAARPHFDLAAADFVLDFGSDFLESWLSVVEHASQFADARNIADNPKGGARFVYVGPRLSMTAGNADEWLAPKPGSEGALALGIARAALDHARASGATPPGAAVLDGVLADSGANAVSAATQVPAETIQRLGRELVESEAPVALPPGVALTSRRATATAAAVLVLDAVIGAVGRTVRVAPQSTAPGQVSSFASMLELTRAMGTGRVGVLIVHESNPVYSMPPDSGFQEALERVGFVVSTSPSPDETSERADLILPDHTPMESWGDWSPRAGLRSLVQPTVRPLKDTQAFGDTLLQTGRRLGEAAAARLPSGSFRQVVEEAWAGDDWREALARGGVFASHAVGGAAVVAPGVAGLEFGEAELDGDGSLLLLPLPSPLLTDGRGANLPWLQETPDPVTKVCWQSWAEVSHTTANRLGVELGDVLSVETPHGRLEVPVLPRGGIRDDTIAIPIGQGHSVGFYASRAADQKPGETRGVNVISVLPAATDETGGRAWLTTRAQVQATGAHRRIPRVMESDNQRGRQLAEAVSLVALAQGGDAEAGQAHGGGHGGGHGEGSDGAHGEATESHEMRRPYDPVDDSAKDSAYRWGMTIDLDRCNGCSACVTACTIENNVPVVGEEKVLWRREMHWLRIERFIGDGDPELVAGRPRALRDSEEVGKPGVRYLPMLCQQCGAAPCEPVCPVFATYHNPEGLNGMIYNRCIGTRYCANNCPYKVRRFNWYDYALENVHEPMQLMLNPDVTVRGQGVMEKCTFCIQRIENGRQQAKDEGRPIADGEVTPACAQSCPTRAITFGNLKDEKSRAVELAEAGQARSYHALHMLNTRPAVNYLAKVQREPHGGDDGDSA